jgi:hypothetical protein
MKCENKKVIVKGTVLNVASGSMSVCPLLALCTNDEKGKTLSIGNGHLQFSIPFEPVAKYFEGNFKKG